MSESRRVGMKKKTRNEKRYSNILDYLDGVDAYSVSSVSTVEQSGFLTKSALANHIELMDTSSVSGETETLTVGGTVNDAESVFTGVKAKIDKLHHESRQKDKVIEELKLVIKKNETREHNRIAETQAANEDHTRILKQDYENVVKRNVTLLNQLLEDKERLTTQLIDTQEALQKQEDTTERKSKKTEQQHLSQIANIKTQLTTTEKQKRAQWIASETKKIKAAAVKALEPDIAMLLSKHKSEIRRVEEEHNTELRRKDQILNDRNREITTLTSKAASDREDALSNVRESFHDRLNDQSRRLETRMDEERRTHLRERQLLEESIEEERRSYRMKVQSLEQSLTESRNNEDNAQRSLHHSLEDHKKEIRQAKDSEIAALRTQLESDKNMEIELLNEKLRREASDFLKTKEEDLTAKLTSQRDLEVNNIISKLEDETLRMNDESRHQQRRLQELLTNAERERDVQTCKLKNCEEENRELKNIINEKDDLLSDQSSRIRRERERWEAERDDVEGGFASRLRSSEVMIESRFESRLSEAAAAQRSLEAEIEKFHQQFVRQKQQTSDQLDDRDEKHGEELEAVQQRVVTTITKKDQEIAVHRETIRKLESKIRQHDDLLLRQKHLISP